MCGIAGFAYRNSSRPADVEQLRAMTEPLCHRGPDAEGYHTGAGVGLGIRRLAIIDLETGDPPVYNEDWSIAVVCNGEIYNYIELRRDLRGAGHRLRTRSDAEVIAHLYEQRGIDCVDHLRGMFAFALWDAGKLRAFILDSAPSTSPLPIENRRE